LVVLGGPYAVLAEVTMRKCPELDVIVYDEEGQIEEIVSGKPLNEIAGLFIRKEGKIVPTASRPLYFRYGFIINSSLSQNTTLSRWLSPTSAKKYLLYIQLMHILNAKWYIHKLPLHQNFQLLTKMTL